MALFLFSGSSSSFSSRFSILALIVLVLLCFCSYCSSSSLVVSPFTDVDPSIDDMDLFDIDDEINYYSPLKFSSHHYRSIPGPRFLPSKNHFRNLLLKSSIIQPDYRHKLYNNKRNTQSFHAMRG